MFQGALTSSDPFGQELQERAEREKRKVLEPIVGASFGIKSALLNIVFGVTLTLLLQYLTEFKARKTPLCTKSHNLSCKMHLSGQEAPNVLAPVWTTESGA
jgi:hypothetical protein